MDPAKVFVVRSGPNLERLKIVPPSQRSSAAGATWSATSA